MWQASPCCTDIWVRHVSAQMLLLWPWLHSPTNQALPLEKNLPCVQWEENKFILYSWKLTISCSLSAHGLPPCPCICTRQLFIELFSFVLQWGWAVETPLDVPRVSGLHSDDDLASCKRLLSTLASSKD